MPTPPPWWSDTQVAPEAVFRRAFKSGQAETASEPPIIASVAPLGSPAACARARAEPADPRRQALEGDPLPGDVEPAMEVRVVRDQRLRPGVGPVDVLG